MLAHGFPEDTKPRTSELCDFHSILPNREANCWEGPESTNAYLQELHSTVCLLHGECKGLNLSSLNYLIFTVSCPNREVNSCKGPESTETHFQKSLTGMLLPHGAEGPESTPELYIIRLPEYALPIWSLEILKLAGRVPMCHWSPPGCAAISLQFVHTCTISDAVGGHSGAWISCLWGQNLGSFGTGGIVPGLQATKFPEASSSS